MVADGFEEAEAKAHVREHQAHNPNDDIELHVSREVGSHRSDTQHLDVVALEPLDRPLV